MSLLLSKAGLVSTVQDNGRHGFSKFGVNVNGCMDFYASQVSNALVGNTLNLPVMEMHFPAPEIIFEKDCLISITGADFHPSVDGNSIPLWKPVQVSRNTRLVFQRKIRGNRCYLGVSGGLDLEPWLGSCSTNLKVNAGGHEGRSLQKGDRLRFGKPTINLPHKNDIGISVLPWTVNHQLIYSEPDVIKFIRGPEWNWLSTAAQQQLHSSIFRVSGASDRMAATLVHEPLFIEKQAELVSAAVTFGTMQLLPNGQLIVLMADHQTTGGYPRAGSIISADLPKFVQLNTGAPFSFAEVSIAEAEKMLISLHQELGKISGSCLHNLRQFNAKY